MMSSKDGILHTRIAFSLFDDHFEIYNDTVETFYSYDLFIKRLYELFRDEIQMLIHEVPKMTNGRIDVILTYAHNPSTINIIYPYDIKVIKK